MFALKTAKVIGTPNGEAWSQIHEFRVEGEKLAKRGILVAVLTLKGLGRGIEAVAAGREILSRINEEYYGDLEGKPFEKLQKTLEKLSKETQSLELVLGAFYGNVGYFGVLGGGKIIVKRGSEIQTVLELAPTPNISVGSGFVEKGDLFLLGSKKFFESVAKGTWRAGLQADDPQEAMEILAPIVAGRENMGGVASEVVKLEIEPAVSVSSEVEAEPESEDVSGEPQPKKTIVGLTSRILRLRPRPIFVRSRADQQARRKTLLTVAVILIFLLLFSFIFGVRKRSGEQSQARFNDLVVQIESKLEEGRDLTAIKPGEARLILKEALDLVDKARGLKVNKQKLESLTEDIKSELSRATKEFQFEELPLFLDLALVNPEAKGEDLIILEDQLVVLDRDGKRLISIDLSLKSTEIIAGGDDLAGSKLLTSFGTKLYVLTEKGILEVKDKKTELVVEKDDNWGNIIDLGTFTGNLYLLDKKRGAIWRYFVTDSGFGTRQSWLKEDVDLADANGFAIDGSIWVATKSKSTPILKFTSGGQEDFLISGLEKPLSPDRAYTNETSEKLYVLDKGNYRIVVANKQGDYQASYLWLGIGGVENFVVDEKNSKIFLLAGSKIYEMEIK